MKKIITTPRAPLAILYFILINLLALNVTANTLTEPPDNNMPVVGTLITGPTNVCEGDVATYTASNPLSGTDPFTFALANPAAGTIISTTSSTITLHGVQPTSHATFPAAERTFPAAERRYPYVEPHISCGET